MHQHHQQQQQQQEQQQSFDLPSTVLLYITQYYNTPKSTLTMDNNNNMEFRIGLEKQNKRNDQVTELILDNCRASQVSGLTDEFVNLETLSLINVGLVTLKGFPKLPKLKKLELSDNRLTGGLNLLHGSPKLQHLNISGNRIKDLDVLEPLKDFHDLVNLDLYNCEVTHSDDYRQTVFDLLPNLLSLDGYDRNEKEVEDNDESEDESSDVENSHRITREDNDDNDDDDDDDDESSDEYDEEECIGNESMGDDEELEDGSSDYDDGEYDEEDDEEEADADGQNPSSEAAAAVAAAAAAAIAANIDSGTNEGHLKEDTNDDSLGNVENGDECEDDDEDEDDDDDDDDGGIDDEDEEGGVNGLLTLEKDIGEEEDESDGDFEPTHEPEERDYEIDPEDDADEDESGAPPLSTSNLNATTDTAVLDDSKTEERGQKRKHDDEAGDEVEGQ